MSKIGDFVNYRVNDIRWFIKKRYASRIIKSLKDDECLIKYQFPDLQSSMSQTRVSEPEISNFQSQPHNSVIKSNPVRMVKTITIDDKEVLYFKHYKPKDWRDIVKFTFFGSKAKREWSNGCKILQMGIIAGEPVAYGEKHGVLFVFDNFLLVKSVSRSNSLTNILSNWNSENAGDFKKKRELLKGLAIFIQKLHLKGILHKDLHTGNILVNEEIINSRILNYESNQIANNMKNTHTAFSIIDLHDVRCKQRLSWRTKEKNIARHLYSLTPFCSRTEIFLVMKRYLECYLGDSINKNNKTVINNIMRNFRHRHMLSRSKRCVKNSSGFSVKSFECKDDLIKGKYRVYLRKPYNNEMVMEAIRVHNEADKLNSVQIIKDTPRISVSAFQITNNGSKHALQSNHHKLCVKEYKNNNIVRQIREALFSSRGKRTWYAANGFVVRKLVTPKPLALIERRRCGLLINSFVITEFVEPGTLVYLYVANYLNTSKETKKERLVRLRGESSGFLSCTNNKIERKRNFIEAFSRSFKNIHKEGIYHADLKGGNILVKEIGRNEWEFFYLDLDRVLFNRLVTKSVVIKNLTQLNASLPNEFSFTDRMRFYKSYSNCKRLSKDDKIMLKKIVIGSLKRKHFWNPLKN